MKTTEQNPDTQLVLASGEGFKLSKQDRQTILSAFAGLDKLSDPLKAEFARVQADVQQVLASFPEESEPIVPGADANTAFANLTKIVKGNQELMQACKAEAEKAIADKLTALASIPTETTKQVEALVTSGEVVKKADVLTKIADAVTAARKAVLEEVKIVSDRRTQLASLKINPADADLVGSDEDFRAKSEKAKARIEKVSSFGLPEDRITQLAWSAPDAQFDDTVALLTVTRAAAIAPPAKPSAGGNPFIAPAVLPSGKKSLGAL